MSNKHRSPSSQDDNLKSDDYCVDMLRSQDQQEKNLAMQALRERYDHDLDKFLRVKGVPQDVVPDVQQETWWGFYNYVIAEPIRVGVQQLLYGIARRKRVDAIRKLIRENEIEHDMPPEETLSVGEKGAVDRPIEDLLEKKELKQLIDYFSLSGSPLADCQRTLFLLRDRCGCKPKLIARLMNKDVQNVYSQISLARRTIAEYLRSEDWQVRMISQELNEINSQATHPKTTMIIEWFANGAQHPRLRQEELIQIGITSDELRHYFITLVLPWTHTQRWLLEEGEVTLLFTPVEWMDVRYTLTTHPRIKHILQDVLSSRFASRWGKDEIWMLTPLDHLVRFHTYGDELQLSEIQADYTFIPESLFLEDKTARELERLCGIAYLSMHKPKVLRKGVFMPHPLGRAQQYRNSLTRRNLHITSEVREDLESILIRASELDFVHWKQVKEQGKLRSFSAKRKCNAYPALRVS